MSGIRNFLKRILPPPVRTFLREIEGLRQLTEQQARLLERGQRETLDAVERLAAETRSAQAEQAEALRRENQRLAKELEAKLEQFGRLIAAEQTETLRRENQQLMEQLERVLAEGRKELTAQTRETVQTLKQVIPNQPVYWNNAFEKRIVKENWGNPTQSPDFAEKFVRLTAGMDGKSTEAIIRVLARQIAYLGSDRRELDLFTRAEQEELRALNENFYGEILKLSDQLFAYRNYLLPVDHFEPSVFYYRHGLDEVGNLDAAKGKAIIDVGGFIGDSVLILSDLHPSAIYTFEAVPENFELLKKTVELNHVPNVVAENVALGESAGTFTVHVSGSGSTSIDRPGIPYTGDIEVPVTTLDDYVWEHHLRVGLIKVDIEGGEPAFLAGAKKTICEQKPILLLSIYHNAHDFFELKPLIESWDLGYRFKIHKPTLPSTTGEILLLAEAR